MEHSKGGTVVKSEGLSLRARVIHPFESIALDLRAVWIKMSQKDESLTPSSSSGIFEIGCHDGSLDSDFYFHSHSQQDEWKDQDHDSNDLSPKFDEHTREEARLDEGLGSCGNSQDKQEFRCPVCLIVVCDREEALNDHLDLCLNRELLEEISSQQPRVELKDEAVSKPQKSISIPKSPASQDLKTKDLKSSQALDIEAHGSSKDNPKKRQRTMSSTNLKQTTLDKYFKN